MLNSSMLTIDTTATRLKVNKVIKDFKLLGKSRVFLQLGPFMTFGPKEAIKSLKCKIEVTWSSIDSIGFNHPSRVSGLKWVV